MYLEERQHQIVGLARRNQSVAVAELARQFGVTAETIRKDLDSLTASGLLRRVHGGAVPAEQLRLIEPSIVDRKAHFLAEKARIAQAALRLIPQGGSILLDGGTTTGALAGALTGEASLVITNSPLAAMQLVTGSTAEVHLLGGRIRSLTEATVGTTTVAALAKLRVDVAFIGANGITPGHGCSTPDPEGAATKAAMLAVASRKVVLADSSKFGQELLTSFASLPEIDVLVTDARIGEADRNALVEAGVEVVIA